MRPDANAALAARVLAGLAGSVAAGALALEAAASAGVRLASLRGGVFDPSRPAFQCVSVGLVAALMIAFVRGRRTAACAVLAVGWGALQLGISLEIGGWRILTRPLWALGVAGGLYLTALAYDALAEAGYRFGKFLVTGPLVAILYVAAAPAALAGFVAEDRLAGEFLLNALLGLAIGDGCGFGVEVAELALAAIARDSESAT